MKQLIIIILFLLPGGLLFAQQEKSLVKDGNKLYEEKKYTEAEANYRKSIQKKKNTEGDFNLGDALYKQKKFDEAGQQFNQLGSTSGNKAIAAKAYHNLGNSLLENKKLEESIDAYKKALINNPKDDETRYNLAYAQEKLKQQQKQDKEQQKQAQEKKNISKEDAEKILQALTPKPVTRSLTVSPADTAKAATAESISCMAKWSTGAPSRAAAWWASSPS